MTTQTAMKAAIADELARSDLTTNIATAITAAITYYQDQHLFTTETRTATFTTVEDQSRYTSSDDADIPLYLDFEAAFIVDSNGEAYELSWMAPAEMEYLLDNSAASGRPHSYSYFAKSVWLYPVPDASTYTFRPIATVKKAAPASDGEADNVWMVEAYALVKARAKLDLAVHTLRDKELAADMVVVVQDELARLRRETSKKAHGGSIQASAF